MPHPYLTDATHPRAFAHRGFVPAEAAAHGTAENTLAAFSAAVAAGAEFLETDCHLTRDGRVVLAHDPDLRRLLGDPRTIAELPHRELRSLMRDRGGLLALEEALEAFPHSRFNVDIKSAAVAEPAGRLLGAHAHRVLLTSFSETLRREGMTAAEAEAARVGAAAPRPATSPGRRALIRILLSVASRSRGRIARALAGFDALQIPERQGALRVLTPRLIAEAHRCGVEVHVWTVDDPERMRALVARGVDGIITDRIDLALEHLAR